MVLLSKCDSYWNSNIKFFFIIHHFSANLPLKSAHKIKDIKHLNSIHCQINKKQTKQSGSIILQICAWSKVKVTPQLVKHLLPGRKIGGRKMKHSRVMWRAGGKERQTREGKGFRRTQTKNSKRTYLVGENEYRTHTAKWWAWWNLDL